MIRSKNRQLAINMISSFVAFVTNLGINFFLTPFVVKRLGIEAYGFLRLSSDIIGYTTIITIALNSMAGRFITIKYQEGKVDEANKYFSSVFFSNVVLSIVVALVLLVFLFNLESFFDIPQHLIIDVKALFSLSVLTTIIALLTNVFSVATFIKNRLELSSIRQIIGNILRALLIILLFGYFPAHLWYFGISGVIITLFVSITDFKFCKYLTPEFRLSHYNYDWSKVKELLKSGVWNMINRLGRIMGEGFNMVIANVCISATAMGIFSITKSVPVIILGFFGMIAGVFAPLFTQLWAQHKKEELLSELLKSIRICGFFANIPLTCLLVFGDSFYRLWLPGEDASYLQLLTILGSLSLIISMPLEPLWNIFTIANKLKYSTLTLVSLNVLIFATIILSMLFVESHYSRLLILAGAGTFWNILKDIFFLPIYGAYCMGYDNFVFYKPLFRSVASFIVSCVVCIIVKSLFPIKTWTELIIIGIVTIIICSIFNSVIVLKKSDRKFIMQKFSKRK